MISKKIKCSLLIVILVLALFPNQAFPQPQQLSKTVNEINTLITSNKSVYFINKSNKGVFVKRFNADIYGKVVITDSIPANEKQNYIQIGGEKLQLDCCNENRPFTFNLFEIKEWNIDFPYLKLIDKNNQIYARILGLRETDLYNLKKEFEKLTKICEYEIKIRQQKRD